jgi:hypothetical protein
VASAVRTSRVLPLRVIRVVFFAEHATSAYPPTPTVNARVSQNIDRAELDRIELAYCISVDKAQGSQFANVIMPVTQSFNFDRTTLYTGLTRAVSRVVSVGSQAVLARAITEPPRSLDRDVALSLGRAISRTAVATMLVQGGVLDIPTWHC